MKKTLLEEMNKISDLVFSCLVTIGIPCLRAGAEAMAQAPGEAITHFPISSFAHPSIRFYLRSFLQRPKWNVAFFVLQSGEQKQCF
jgi:hypothetical protein